MIDSANIDVIRKNIQDLAKAQDPNRIANVEYQVGELENVVGSTEIPGSETITNYLTRFLLDTVPFVKFRTINNERFIIRYYTTDNQDDNDFMEIQFLANTNKIRFIIKTGGNITYDKSVTLS